MLFRDKLIHSILVKKIFLIIPIIFFIIDRLIKYFDIICGKGEDVEKIPELKDRLSEHQARMRDNKIVIHRFSDWRQERNVDLKKMIEALL